MKNKFLRDFRNFAMKGNVIDMAVGVIIGGAFGKIVSSLVSDVIMPLVGILAGGVNLVDLHVVLKPEKVVDGVTHPAVVLSYGKFIQTAFDFMVIAFSIFVFLRALSYVETRRKKLLEKRKTAALAKSSSPDAAPASPSLGPAEEILSDIRDLLRKMNEKDMK